MSLPTAWMSLPAVQLSDRVVTREQTMATVEANFRGSPEEWARVSRLLRAVMNACGTANRHLDTDNPMATAQYAARAVRRLIDEQGLAPSDVDLVVYGSIARGYLEPATANEVATLSGLEQPLCYDVLAACAGMVIGVQDAVARLAVDESLNTAVVATCALDAGRLNHDIQSAEDVAIYAAGLTVGTASTATLVSRERRVVDGVPLPAGRVRGLYARSWPGQHALCVVPLQGPFTSQAAEMFRLARFIPDACREVARRSGWSVEDVDLWAFHQASDRSLNQIASQLGIPLARIPAIHGEYGNCESSSAALTLRTLHDRGLVQPGMKVVLGTASAGFMIAAVGLDWA